MYSICVPTRTSTNFLYTYIIPTPRYYHMHMWNNSTQCAGDTNKLCFLPVYLWRKTVAILYLANIHIIIITHVKETHKYDGTWIVERWVERTSQTNWFLWDISLLVQPLHTSINLCCTEEIEQMLQGCPAVQVCVDLVIAQGNHCPSKAANIIYHYCREYSPMTLG